MYIHISVFLFICIHIINNFTQLIHFYIIFLIKPYAKVVEISGSSLQSGTLQTADNMHENTQPATSTNQLVGTVINETREKTTRCVYRIKQLSPAQLSNCGLNVWTLHTIKVVTTTLGTTFVCKESFNPNFNQVI